jgi:mRNA-degrading endonuclease YafQ of YafQ-DinJ toxin-antitoxin module
MQRKPNLQVHIEFSSSFDKDIDKTPLEVQIAFRGIYELFQEDPNNEILRNHSLNKLGKRYHGLWSIDVTDNFRAIYRKEENKTIFIMIRTHERLYGK